MVGASLERLNGDEATEPLSGDVFVPSLGFGHCGSPKAAVASDEAAFQRCLVAHSKLLFTRDAMSTTGRT
jgi:hypothetical protein